MQPSTKDSAQRWASFRRFLKKALIFPFVLLIRFYQVCISPYTRGEAAVMIRYLRGKFYSMSILQPRRSEP